MKDLKIEGTKFSPKVNLSADGELTISGRSIMEDPIVFYKPVIEALKQCQAKKFTLEIRLEYMNTSSTKVLLDLMRTIKDHFNTSNTFINWYYESDDEDMFDIGKDFESLLSIPIDFYEMCEN